MTREQRKENAELFGHPNMKQEARLGIEELDGICCVCGHKLSSHVDEKDWWRCHSILTPDMSQCECRLLKDGVEEDGIGYYDTGKRVREAMRDV